MNLRRSPHVAIRSAAIRFAVLLISFSSHANLDLHADDESTFFESKVRPVLQTRCFGCHGVKAKSGLRVDSLEALLSGGKRGAAIVPGKPSKSLILDAVRYTTNLKMPPDRQLPAREIAALSRWIRDGAKWPQTETTRAKANQITDEERAFWSFQPIPKRIPIPKPKRDDWRTNPIDAFVAMQHDKLGLTPNPEAPSHILIRRLYYDLIGLPPTPKELGRFAGKLKQREVYDQLIERLLSSPQYGERWGRHWLDVVRYADTAGDAADFPVPEAYKYRNYVIQAFNEDKPYDRFILEQLAGDLLGSGDDDERWRQIIATGYIAISRRIGVSPHGLRHITIESTLDNLGKTFLGLTIGCARCHDHKFDPIPTSDYYALYGIFDSSVYPHAGAEHKPHRENFVYRLGDEADRTLAPFRKELDKWNRLERQKLEEYRLFQREKITDPTKSREKAWRALLEVREQRRPFAERFPSMEIAYGIQDGHIKDARIHLAGNPRDLGPVVDRGFLQILGGMKLKANEKNASGRLQLAQWIASPDNPLTARVIANRIWMHHFGTGLVATPNDFGLRGARPTHPQLLDFLARYLIEQGWSVKQLHRLILRSKTYRLASNGAIKNPSQQTDPDNRWLWRFQRRRLDAEQLRDSILRFAGRLDFTPGGRHPFPHHLTYFYRQHEPFVGNFESNRRSVYLMQQRIKKNDFLDLFDGPDGNLELARRRATVTTLQALFAMNSEFMQSNSQAIAGRIIAEKTANDGQQKIAKLFRMLYSRSPTQAERERLDQFINESRSKTTVDKWTSLVRVMLSSNEFMHID